MNCEPGDIARIVAPENNPNIGKLVQCKRIYPANPYPEQEGPCWVISSKEILQTWDTGGGFHIGSAAVCPDAWLKPHRPPALDKNIVKEKDLETV
jgi:hypothetical protein